ncbi:Heparan sulfate glucosamine 3-O-sulfotransferase 1 [Hondaea fermentalgiana]|uniref:Heparan sulfate glucosamine 3-O-sulfotransferase 1 n=1 Tax=Hondaea fermentalgiana TaxID=2315210 RepID=A0A2R5GJU5_9STRA|nr:Heparan sulfate glucosamine 3-O-sulfotransferase 1 [Hondaea fermentalgiana]|eukprot:GBG28551.1 Heparan sulfate glucosamine 3-O-sulfotransferase 1 [Hondaea fermentalgiana]
MMSRIVAAVVSIFGLSAAFYAVGSGDGVELVNVESAENGLLALESASELSAPPVLQNFYNDTYSTYHCSRHHDPGSLPDYFVIGVHKGGSTALYSYLSQHGNIRPATCKETRFFVTDKAWKKGLTDYRRLFPDTSATPGILTGEGTPSYIRIPKAVVRIADAVPNAKFIVCFRNPTQRFISHYVGQFHRERTKLSCVNYFERDRDALDTCINNYTPSQHKFMETDVQSETAWSALKRLADPTKVADAIGEAPANFASPDGTCAADDSHCKRRYCMGLNYESAVVRSVYVDQLVRWLRFFPADRILVTQSEAMFKDAPGTLNRVANFLGLRPFNEFEIERFTSANTGSSHHTSELFSTCDLDSLNAFFAPENGLFEALLIKQFPEVYSRWISWDDER